MTNIRADITTTRASRYLVQLCTHADAIGARNSPLRDHADGSEPHDAQVRADWSDSSGVIIWSSGGRATLTADATTLTVCIDAADDVTGTAIRNALTRDLRRIGTRERLDVVWQRHPEIPPGRLTTT